MSSRRLRSQRSTPRQRRNEADAGACIDLTVDIGGDEVIDLTRHSNIMDSSVVILSPTDDVGPIRRRRGSGRRGVRRSRHPQTDRSLYLSPPLNMPSSSGTAQQDVVVENSDEELPDIPFEISEESSAANSKFMQSDLQSPPLKITCPVCLDDLKQIKSSKRRVMSTVCGHIFCEDCITSAIRTLHSCPSCRKHLALSKIHPIFL